MRDMKLRNWKDLEKLNKQSWQTQAQVVTGTLTELTATLANKSRLMFEINERAAHANVVMKTIESVQAAFAWGMSAGGPYVAAAAAAAAGIYGATLTITVLR